MKRIETLIIIAFFSIALSVCLGPAQAGAESMRGVELVVVLENSRVVAQSDPDGERFEALSILVDLMDPADLIGAVRFAREAAVIRELSWKGTGGLGAELLKDLSENSSENRDRDLEKALSAALGLFEVGENASDVPKRAVVIIGSGRIDVGSEDENEKSRNRIFSEILPRYEKSGIPVYAIGVGREQNVELIEAIGSLSDGFHFSLESPHGFSSAAIDIFNDIKHLDIAPLEGLSFRIGENVEEALIVANGGGMNDEKCGLLSPTRIFYRKDKNSDEISWSGHKKYNIIRLYKPEAGRWNLHSRADHNCVVFLDSARRIKFRTPRKLMFHDENIVVAAYLDQGGRMVQNPQILERTVFKASLENESHNETASVELQNTEPGIYTGNLPLEGFKGIVHLNLYALSTDIANKSYSLINISEKSWLELVSPPAEIPAGEMPDIEAQVLSEIDEKGRYEMAAQLDLGGVGSWSAEMERMKELRMFRGHIEADLVPGDYVLSLMLRRFDSPVAEEMQVKTCNIHVTGMIEQRDRGGFGWLLIVGGAGLLITASVGGFFWFKRRKRLAELIKEEIPMTILPPAEEKEAPQAAVLEDMKDIAARPKNRLQEETGDATMRIDPLEQLTQNLKVDEPHEKEPKLAIESQGLMDVIDQVVQNVDGRVDKEVKAKKKVTGAYQEEEEVLMVRSGGNVNLKVPGGMGIDRLAESLDSAELEASKRKEETEAVGKMSAEQAVNPDQSELVAGVIDAPLSDEPVMLSGGLTNDEDATLIKGAGGTESQLSEIIAEDNPPDMRVKVSASREVPGEKPMQKKARVPAPPQVSQNELDALLQQARQNIDKN